MKKISLIILTLITGFSAYAIDYPGKVPGTAALTIDSKTISLQNDALRQSWKIINNTLVPDKLPDIQGKTSIELSTSELFYVMFDGKVQNLKCL